MEQEKPATGGGDPLRAMYLIATVLLAAGSIVVVLLMFVPRDVFSRSDPGAVWVPGSGATYDAPVEPLTVEQRLEQNRIDEEHHLH